MKNKSILTKIRQIKNKLELVNIFGGKCEICNNNNFIVLCFHHIDPNSKKFEISDKIRLSYNDLYEEAKKCQLLCQNCHRELHYKNNKDERRNDKLIYLEYAGAKCVRCEYNKCPAALTFHHRDPNTKEFWIGDLNERIGSIVDLSNKIKNEIDKCDLLCSNCNTIEHFDIQFYTKNKEIIINYKVKKICKKVNRDKVFELHNSGIKNKEIATMMNCAKSTISDIIRKR